MIAGNGETATGASKTTGTTRIDALSSTALVIWNRLSTRLLNGVRACFPPCNLIVENSQRRRHVRVVSALRAQRGGGLGSERTELFDARIVQLQVEEEAWCMLRWCWRRGGEQTAHQYNGEEVFPTASTKVMVSNEKAVVQYLRRYYLK